MYPKQLLVAITLAFGLAAPALAVPPAAEAADDLLPRSVFQVLLGEIALQRGAVGLSLDAWEDLSRRTDDPRVIARAAEIAGFAGQHERALKLARRWQELEPDSVKARQTQAALLVQLKRFDELVPLLLVLLEQDKENLQDNLLHLNRMLARVGDKAAAFRLIERLTQAYDGMPEAHFAVAQAALAVADEGRARVELVRALDLRRDWEGAVLVLAQLQARQSVPEAIASLDKFVGRQPAARDARLALARLLLSEQDLVRARGHFEFLVKAHPEDPAVVYPLAILALQNGEVTQAQGLLEKLVGSSFPDQGTVHFFLGQIAQDAGDNVLALGHFRQVGSGDRYLAARVRAAGILQQQGKLDEARALLNETRSTTPAERAQVQLSEAHLLREAGEHAAAYTLLAQALASQPDHLELLYDAALTAERIGRHDLLEAHLQHLLLRQPEHSHALNALGYSFAERNIRLDEAEALILKALTLAQDDPYITDSLGWVQFRQGRLPDALASLRKAFRLKADPEIAAHLGEVLWSLGERDEARRIWREAAERSPANAPLQATIKKFLP